MADGKRENVIEPALFSNTQETNEINSDIEGLNNKIDQHIKDANTEFSTLHVGVNSNTTQLALLNTRVETLENGGGSSSETSVTLYVSGTNGSDDNDGTTTSKAFLSFTKAIEEAKKYAHAIIFVDQGTYGNNEEITIIGRSISVQALIPMLAPTLKYRFIIKNGASFESSNVNYVINKASGNTIGFHVIYSHLQFSGGSITCETTANPINCTNSMAFVSGVTFNGTITSYLILAINNAKCTLMGITNNTTSTVVANYGGVIDGIGTNTSLYNTDTQYKGRIYHNGYMIFPVNQTT